MENRPPLLPSPQLLSSPMLPSSRYDYFHQRQEEPAKRVHFANNGHWQLSSGPSPFHTNITERLLEFSVDTEKNAYLTPDPSSQLGFSSPLHTNRRPLASIPILTPKCSGEAITIGRSSVQCTHPIPKQWLNMHISRVHVVLHYLPTSRELCVKCTGLNPIYIHTSFETHKLDKNDKMTFQQENIKINIAGYVVLVTCPDPSDEERRHSVPAILTPPSSRTIYTDPEKRTQTPTPGNVPPQITSPSPIRKRSITFPSSPEAPLPEIEIYHDAQEVLSQSSLSPPPETIVPPEPMSSPAEMSQLTRPGAPIDPALLDALLTTLIFAEVKPASFPRLVADLAHRMPHVPEEQVRYVLTNTHCIGIVRRSGKDAAGKMLSDEYYYVPESIHLLED